jgi:hypothetical protein
MIHFYDPDAYVGELQEFIDDVTRTATAAEQTHPPSTPAA